MTIALDNQNWINDLQRQALSDELAAQEEDISRAERKIRDLDERIQFVAKELDKLREQHAGLVRDRVQHAKNRDVLKEAMGL